MKAYQTNNTRFAGNNGTDVQPVNGMLIGGVIGGVVGALLLLCIIIVIVIAWLHLPKIILTSSIKRTGTRSSQPIQDQLRMVLKQQEVRLCT